MTKVTDGLIKFAGGEANLGVYKMFADYWNHYRSLNGSKGVEFDNTISFSEKEDKMNAALRKEILRVSGQNLVELPLEHWASNPMVKWASFAVTNMLIDFVLPSSIIDSIGAYTDVRTIGWGDSAAFEVKSRDLFTVSKAGRGQRSTELHKQYAGLVTVVPVMRELSVFVSLYRVLAGKESLAEFVAKAVRSLETAVTVDVYNLMSTTMNALVNTPAAAALRVSGYTQADLISLAQKVQAWNGGAEAVIVGTKAALGNIVPLDPNYRYDLVDSPYVKMGYVPTAFGYSMLMLPQVADWETPFQLKLADDRVWLLSPSSQKIVKLVLEGATMSNTTDVYQNANLTQTNTIWKSFGTAVATNAVPATIEL